MIVLLILIIYANLVICEDFTQICERNNEIIPVQAFRVNNIAVLFVTLDGETKAIRIKLSDKIFDKTSTKINIKDVWSDDIKLWPDWNRHQNGTIIKQINDFISVYRMKQNLVQNDINDNSLIFTTLDPAKLEMDFMFGYHVIYDETVTSIVSVNQFKINPYKRDKINDKFNLASFYANFPTDFIEKTTPIVTYYVPQSPRRAIAYYKEVNPKIPSESNYKIHFLIQNLSSTPNANENEWVYDMESSECIRKTTETYSVNAAFDLTDVKSSQVSYYSEQTKSLHIIEFYKNGEYAKLEILVTNSGAVFNPNSFNNIDGYYKIRDIFCLQKKETTPFVEFTSTTISSIVNKSLSETIGSSTMSETPIGEQSSSATEKRSTKPPTALVVKSSKWWIWLVVILAFLIGAAVIGLFFYLKSRQTPDERDVELREIPSEERAADEAEDREGEGLVESNESLRTQQSETMSEESVGASSTDEEGSGGESNRTEVSERSNASNDSSKSQKDDRTSVASRDSTKSAKSVTPSDTSKSTTKSGEPSVSSKESLKSVKSGTSSDTSKSTTKSGEPSVSSKESLKSVKSGTSSDTSKSTTKSGESSVSSKESLKSVKSGTSSDTSITANTDDQSSVGSKESSQSTKSGAPSDTSKTAKKDDRTSVASSDSFKSAKSGTSRVSSSGSSESFKSAKSGKS